MVGGVAAPEVNLNTESPIVPDYYHIEFDDGLALRVLLRGTPSGDMPYVELFIAAGVFRKPVDAHLKTVEGAAIDIATELEGLAASLRRMAGNLPAPSESK
jgi:hypothetical protein